MAQETKSAMLLAQPGGIQRVRARVLARRPVLPQLRPRDAERQQSVRHVAERLAASRAPTSRRRRARPPRRRQSRVMRPAHPRRTGRTVDR